jgi:PiT family inorganic phosphate transporter
VIAALFLAFIKFNILHKEDKISAAKRWIPILVAIMMSLFSMYLIIKGLKKVWRPELPVVFMTGAIIFATTYGLGRLAVKMGTFNVANRREGVNRLFIIPLICSAALLSFTHGANDVANAIGPLAAIVHAASAEGIAAKVTIPIWVMGIGALGISAGLILYGPKVIHIVGEQITTLNPVRAFCVALAAATTVIRRLGFGHARQLDPYCPWCRLWRRPVP